MEFSPSDCQTLTPRTLLMSIMYILHDSSACSCYDAEPLALDYDMSAQA